MNVLGDKGLLSCAVMAVLLAGAGTAAAQSSGRAEGAAIDAGVDASTKDLESADRAVEADAAGEMATAVAVPPAAPAAAPAAAADAGAVVPLVGGAGAVASPAADAGAAAPPTSVLNFKGQLLELGTRRPMVGLLVTVFRDMPAGPAGFEATTDGDGRFTFFNLDPGEWRVFVEAPGYYPFRTTEEIRPGQATVVTYLLERGTYNPYDVTVTAERPRKEVSRIVLPASVIDKIPGTWGDPLVALQNLPGVARTPLFGGQVVVRGAAPEDTQVFVDGATVPNIYHFDGLRSVLPVGILESIDFQPGNFSSFYGRAIGGIIDVQIKKLNPKRLSATVDVSLLDAGVYLETPVGGQAAVAVAIRRSYIDVLAGGGGTGDGGVKVVTAPRYYDYQLVANYRPANAHDLRALFFGSDDRLSIVFGKPGALATQLTGNRFDQHEGFYRALLEYRYLPGGRLENSVSASAGSDTQDVSLGQVALKLDTATVHLRDTTRWKVTRALTAVGGLDLLFQQLSGLARLPPIAKEGVPMGNVDFTRLIETHLDGRRAWSPAGFAELELHPVTDLYLSAGVRGDYFSRISQATWAPRLVARYRLPGPLASVTIKGGAGLYFQEPQIDETDANFGNPALKAQRAVHLSAGLEWKPRPFVTVDGTFFHKNLSSMVSPTGASVTENGSTRPLRYDNGGVGRVVGFELLIKHDFSEKFAGWIAYTLSRSERLDSGTTTVRLFDFDQTHILAAVATYQLPRNWQIGTRFRLVSGTPQTPVIGSIYNNVSDTYDPTYGAPNSSRAPPFHQLDIRVDKRWIYPSCTATAYLDLQNVYNRANAEGPPSYNYDFTKSGITQGLPIMTILGFKVEY